MSNHSAVNEATPNPLDKVEDVLSANDWTFERMTRDELIVHVSGRHCDYNVFFIWQEDMSALQFCCQYDFEVANDNVSHAGRVLMRVNEGLWMGHFDIPEDSLIPSFRHTCLFRGLNKHNSNDFLADLVEISLAQCEKHFPVFHLLANNEKLNEDTLSLALMDNSGEA